MMAYDDRVESGENIEMWGDIRKESAKHTQLEISHLFVRPSPVDCLHISEHVGSRARFMTRILNERSNCQFWKDSIPNMLL